jgi:hypothetical protein
MKFALTSENSMVLYDALNYYSNFKLKTVLIRQLRAKELKAKPDPNNLDIVCTEETIDIIIYRRKFGIRSFETIFLTTLLFLTLTRRPVSQMGSCLDLS